MKRLVVTSSLAAISGGMFKKDTGETLYSEKDYAPIEGSDPYAIGKIMQEKVIEKYLKSVDSLNDGYHLEIVRLMPTLCIGPTLLPTATSSAEGISKLMNHEYPGVPKLMIPYVDVRDVAQANINALTFEGVNGMRFLIS